MRFAPPITRQSVLKESACGMFSDPWIWFRLVDRQSGQNAMRSRRGEREATADLSTLVAAATSAQDNHRSADVS